MKSDWNDLSIIKRAFMEKSCMMYSEMTLLCQKNVELHVINISSFFSWLISIFVSVQHYHFLISTWYLWVLQLFTTILFHLSVCLCSVFGISPIVQSNCSYTWKLIMHPERKWNHFVSPIMLLILYYTLATLIRLWLQEPTDQLTVRTAGTDAMKEPEIDPLSSQHSDIYCKIHQ